MTIPVSRSRRTFPVAFLLLLMAASSVVFGQGDDPVIKIDSATVLLNATILDTEGNVVSGLRREQFSVFENGRKQEISYFSTAETPFAGVILIDTSGSMEARLSMARSAAITFLDGLRTDDNVAVYRFASKVELVQEFSGSRDISEAIFDVKADGMTALNDAVFKAAEELKARHEKRKAIIVISDGADTISGRSAERALKAALDAQALIYTIDMSGIESGMKDRMQNQGVLKNFAEKSGGRFIAAQGGQALRLGLQGIVDELGIQYTLGYEPADQQRDGKWRAIELRVAKPKLTIRTRKGYTAEK
ncbi:MAG: VWA domain-containing protein [Acidobacteria bacterium]|nr:VWA domain-containing protein [Acidobacteriota bacterium]